MRLAPLVLLAVIAAPAAGEIPLLQSGQRWIRVTSPNFTVISSAGGERTREVADTLETVAAALRRVHPRFDARFTDTTVFLLSRRRDCQPIFDLLLNQRTVNSPGAFVVQPDGSATIIVDAGRSAGRTIRHELMHNILAASGTRLPLWLEEGIAEYFSTTVVQGDSVIMGRPIVPHYRSLRARGPLPVEDLLSMQSGSPMATNVVFYAHSWALVEWMMRTNRRAFYTFVADVERGEDAALAFRRHFPIDIGTVSRSFRMPVARPPASTAVQIDRPEIQLSEEAIPATEALYRLARFFGQMDNTREDGRRFLDAVLAVDPSHARAVAAQGLSRHYEAKYDAAAPLFEKALAMAPHDPEVQLAVAEGLLRHAVGPFLGTADVTADAPHRFRRARELARAAMSAGPSPLAEGILGASYLVEDEVAPGIAALEKAFGARPGRRDFALNLYALYLRTDRDADAGRIFSSFFSRPRNAESLPTARAIYVRERIRKINRLIERGEFDGALDLFSRAISAAPDEVVRASLATHATNLQRVADRNRQVVLYNEAVDAFNAQRMDAALERCDRLLASNVDRDIREQTERLRTRARARLGM